MSLQRNLAILYGGTPVSYQGIITLTFDRGSLTEHILNNQADLSNVLYLEINGTPYTVQDYLAALDASGDFTFTSTQNTVNIVISSNMSGLALCMGSTCTEASFADDLENLSDQCFQNCPWLRNVDLTNISGINDDCFDGCDNLETFVMNTVPVIGTNSFGESNFSGNIYGAEFCRINCTYAVKSELEQSQAWATIIGCFVPKATLDMDMYYFSVSASKRVAFSYGNLRYRGSLDRFTFAKQPYEIIGNNPGNTTKPQLRSAQTDMIDLFSWASSGGTYPGYQRHTKPYDCVYYSSASAYAYYYGIVYGSQNYSYSLDGTGADWGVANTFDNHTTPSGWRCLNRTEWTYLYSGRSNAAALRAWAKINGTCGVIFLPDNWVLPSGASLTTGTTNYLTNVLTVGEWRVLENAGAIFLSASGYRNGVTANNATITADTYTGNVSPTVGDANQSNNPVGSYWSTTYSGSNAYRFYFGNTTVTPAQTGGVRYYGYAVRLVRDIT